MWEDDKKMIRAYKDCFRNLLTEMREGGDVDLANACVQETKALQTATEKAIKYYKDGHPLAVPDRKQAFHTPVTPYFQNL